MVPIICTIIIIIIAAIPIAIKTKAITKEYEEEKYLEAEIIKENEVNEEKLKSKCLICQECSMGNAICDNCWNRSIALKKELPYKLTDTYEKINEYQKNLMLKVLYPETRFEKETCSTKLISIAIILKEKYSVEKAFQHTYEFLDDINELNKEEIIDIYELKKNTIPNEEPINLEESTTDFRQKFPKPYRCKDGDYVRSKSEREIDDFFFDNRIWHIYEHEYTHPITGKMAETDFFLPDYNLYIEYFGMTDPDYLKRRDEKISMYQSDTNINFEYLTYEDDNNIYQKLKQICLKYNISVK